MMKKNVSKKSCIKNQLFQCIRTCRSLVALILLLFAGLGNVFAFENYGEITSIYMQQNNVVSGLVTDDQGEVIPGVNISIEGTTIGTISDFNGKYTLSNVKIGSTLVFSFIGMKTEKVKYEGQPTINMKLVSDALGIEEVIVVGFGEQKKESVIGAISNIKADEMSTTATSNLTNTIGGMTPGVFSVMGEGRPGADDASLNIRGLSTLNDNSILVLVDGIESDFGRLNPNDIESFSVLKDASATAVYGVRGANGVILVTTKRGATGKAKVSINSQFRVHQIIKYPKFLNSYDWARLRNEAEMHGNGAYLNGSIWNPRYAQQDLDLFLSGDDPYGHPNINWFEELTNPTYYEHRHDVSVRGGTDKVKYYVSGEFVSQDGAYKQWSDQKYNTNSTYDRLNLRTNFDFTVTKTTSIDVSMSNRLEVINDVKSGTIGEVSERGGIWDDIMALPPNNNPLHNPNGTYAAPGGEGRDLKPYATLRAGGYKQNRGNYFQGSFKLKQKLDFITQGLNFRAMVGLNAKYRYQYTLDDFPAIWEYKADTKVYTQLSREEIPSSTIGTNQNSQIYHGEAAFEYSRGFGSHNIAALALAYQDKNSNGGAAPENNMGIAGRVSYDFMNKYLAEINVGYNGSDRFAEGRRYAMFPAMSLGWLVSEESFLQSQNVIKYMKIRGSYGEVGNDKIGSSYDYYYAHLFDQSGWSRNAGYLFGNPLNKVGMIREGTLGNDMVTWETAAKTNIGIDFNILSNDLSFTFDYFMEDRNDILWRRSAVPQTMGHEGTKGASLLPPENFAKVHSEGYEFSAKYNTKFRDWTFNFNGNLSYSTNKIVQMDEVKNEYDYMNATGKPMGQHFGYIWSGEFYSYEDLGYVWDESLPGENKYTVPEGGLVPSVPVPDLKTAYPGDLKFVDRNKDGYINNLDFGDIGYTETPEIIYGLNFSVGYKNLKLTTFWQGASRFSVNYSQTALTTEFKNGGGAHEVHMDRWAYFPDQGIDTRASAKYPRLAFDGSGYTQLPSSFKVHDATYIRLKRAELSYSLPKHLVEKLRMESARFFLTGSNLITFDNIGYLDPEMPGSAAAYPQSKFYGIGLNVGF